jgi:DNA replication protein DnaD
VSTDKGFIKIYRDIRHHWIWSDPDYLKAWIDLLMMVNHEDKQVLFDKRLVTVRRGSRITSIRKLAERWGWSRGRVSHFLDTLEQDGMIATEKDTKKTLIIVEKYGFYQGRQNQKKPQKKPQTGPQTEPQTGPQTEHKQETRRMIKNEEEGASLVFSENDETDEAEGWGYD